MNEPFVRWGYQVTNYTREIVEDFFDYDPAIHVKRLFMAM